MAELLKKLQETRLNEDDNAGIIGPEGQRKGVGGYGESSYSLALYYGDYDTGEKIMLGDTVRTSKGIGYVHAIKVPTRWGGAPMYFVEYGASKSSETKKSMEFIKRGDKKTVDSLIASAKTNVIEPGQERPGAFEKGQAEFYKNWHSPD